MLILNVKFECRSGELMSQDFLEIEKFAMIVQASGLASHMTHATREEPSFSLA